MYEKIFKLIDEFLINEMEKTKGTDYVINNSFDNFLEYLKAREKKESSDEAKLIHLQNYRDILQRHLTVVEMQIEKMSKK